MTTSYYLLHINCFLWIDRAIAALLLLLSVCVCCLWSQLPFLLCVCAHTSLFSPIAIIKLLSIRAHSTFALLDTCACERDSHRLALDMCVCVCSLLDFFLPSFACCRSGFCEWCRHLNVSTCWPYFHIDFWSVAVEIARAREKERDHSSFCWDICCNWQNILPVQRSRWRHSRERGRPNRKQFSFFFLSIHRLTFWFVISMAPIRSAPIYI